MVRAAEHFPDRGEGGGVGGRAGDEEGQGGAGQGAHVHEAGGDGHRGRGTDVDRHAGRHQKQDREDAAAQVGVQLVLSAPARPWRRR